MFYDVQATCSNLGVYDGSVYHPDPDCVECVKDLIRFLRRDDESHAIRRALGDLGVLKSDLVHILRYLGSCFPAVNVKISFRVASVREG